MRSAVLAFLLVSFVPQTRASSISDVPMEARFRSAAPVMMILLDDSLSMSGEVTAGGETACGVEYLFDDVGDHLRPLAGLAGKERMTWRYRWSGFNRLYYDPAVEYRPWPGAEEADPARPRSHPMHPAPTLGLDDTYFLYNSGTLYMTDSEARYSGHWTLIPGQAHVAVEAGNRAAYTPDIACAGLYEVFAYADPKAGCWDNQAAYTLVHEGKESPTTVYRSQGAGNGWTSLGIYSFGQGRGGSVTVERVRPGDSGPVLPTCADEMKFVPQAPAADSVDIKNAQYYVWSHGEKKPYLVILDGEGPRYYAVHDAPELGGNGDGRIDPGELVSAVLPPGDVALGRSLSDERRNFADWYSFYRRRLLSAVGAAAGVISEIRGVKIGLYGVNSLERCDPGRLVQPALPVKVAGADESRALLAALYTSGVAPAHPGSPLRTALRRIGQYFDQDDGIRLDGSTGCDSPYAGPEEGGACQKAFAVLITDGDWNGPGPGTGNADGDNGSPYSDDRGDTLADVAMRYYEKDLSSVLQDRVAADTWDRAVHQHLATYALALGCGSIDPLDMNGNGMPDRGEPGVTPYEEDPAFTSPWTPVPAWPDPCLGSAQKADDLLHAAVNGRGVLFSATDPARLRQRLSRVALGVRATIGSGASALPGGGGATGHAKLVMAYYDSSDWTGELTAHPIDPESGAVLYPGDSRFTSLGGWNASEALAALSPDRRIIVTYDGESRGMPFRWDALTTIQKAALVPSWEDDASRPPLGDRIVRFLRGEEIEGFRRRSSALGDVVHAAPVWSSRGGAAAGTVFAAANDGMLHAFDSETGAERFAYVPNLLFRNRECGAGGAGAVSCLRELSSPTYLHRFFVDLTPHVAEVSEVDGLTQEGEAPAQGVGVHSGSRTILVGGLGKGGKGYYALDVTGADGVSDESDAAGLVLWEYPRIGSDGAWIRDDDLGYSFSRAVVVQSNIGKNSPEGASGWIVVFGNGYESPNGQAILYIMDLRGGVLRKIGTDTAQGPANGLSTPCVIDADGDGLADYAYAGDLMGNLWKFDLTSEHPEAWRVAFFDGDTPKPLFRATWRGTDGRVVPQPVTVQPDVMYHCREHGYMVVFATGRFLGEEDLQDRVVQSVYGIWDYGDDSDDAECLGQIIDRDTGTLSHPKGVRLLRQEEADWRGTGLGERLRTLTAHAADWTCSADPGGRPDPAVHAGWFFDLPGFVSGEIRMPGERVIRDPLLWDRRAVIVSTVPSAAPCESGGMSMVHELDACTGARLPRAALDYNADGRIDAGDHRMIEVRDESGGMTQVPPTGVTAGGILNPPAVMRMPDGTRTKEIKIFSGSAGGAVQILEAPERRGVVSWREWTRD